MMFLRALVIGLLALGAVTAAPAAQASSSVRQSSGQPLSQSSNFDLIGWLRRQVYEEQRDLVVANALKSWYSKNPDAAAEAQSEFSDYVKHQQEINRSLQEQLSINSTEALEKQIKSQQLELDTRRALLKELDSMDDQQIKQVIAQYQDEFDDFMAQQHTDNKFTTQQMVYGSGTGGESSASSLKSMLEASLANAQQGLEINRRAYQALLSDPNAAAQAEQLRQAVFQRMLDEGSVSQRAYDKAEELGATQALNRTVFMGERIVRGLQIALEILNSQPQQVPTYTYQIQQMMQDPDFLQQMSSDEFMTQQMASDDAEFDTMQFGGLGGLGGSGALRSLMPLLARQAYRRPVPFGQFSGQGGQGLQGGAQGGFGGASPFIAYM